MKYKLFTRTTTFRGALRKDLQKAKKSIYIEMYIFIDDTTDKYNFIDLLIQKAKEGREIVLILDAFGSRELNK